MKALGPLAVAARDILARTPAPHSTRSNRARAGDSTRFARRQRPSPFQSARDEIRRTSCHNLGWSVPDPTNRSLADWKGEAGSRAEAHSRLSDPYPSERSERGYVAQRPRARRGLPSHDHDCGHDYLDCGCGRSNNAEQDRSHRSSSLDSEHRRNPGNSETGKYHSDGRHADRTEFGVLDVTGER